MLFRSQILNVKVIQLNFYHLVAVPARLLLVDAGTLGPSGCGAGLGIHTGIHTLYLKVEA